MIAGLFMGASFFSYVVGSFCGVLAKLSERETEQQALLSELNLFIKESHVNSGLATRLRAYFRHIQHGCAPLTTPHSCLRRALMSAAPVRRTDTDWGPVLEVMSPALRGAVALQMNAGWIRQLGVFSGCPQSMLIRLSFLFQSDFFPPGEVFVHPGDVLKEMTVVRRGVAMRGCHGRVRVVCSGGVVGDECLWTGLGATYSAVSLTFLVVQRLSAASADSVLHDFPAYIARSMRPYFRRRMVREAILIFLGSVHRVRCAVAAAGPRAEVAMFCTSVAAPRRLGSSEPQPEGRMTLSELLAAAQAPMQLQSDLADLAGGVSGGASGSAPLSKRGSIVSSFVFTAAQPPAQPPAQPYASWAEESGLEGVEPTQAMGQVQYPVAALLLAVEKGAPELFYAMTLAATRIQRIWRAQCKRAELTRHALEAERLGVPLADVVARALRSAAKETEPTDRELLTRLAAKQSVLSADLHAQRAELAYLGDAVQAVASFLDAWRRESAATGTPPEAPGRQSAGPPAWFPAVPQPQSARRSVWMGRAYNQAGGGSVLGTGRASGPTPRHPFSERPLAGLPPTPGFGSARASYSGSELPSPQTSGVSPPNGFPPRLSAVLQGRGIPGAAMLPPAPSLVRTGREGHGQAANHHAVSHAHVAFDPALGPQSPEDELQSAAAASGSRPAQRRSFREADGALGPLGENEGLRSSSDGGSQPALPAGDAAARDADVGAVHVTLPR